MIRQAELKDRHAMVRMAHEFFAETSMPYRFDPAWAEASVKAWIDSSDKLAVVLDQDGVSGMLCAAWVNSPLAPIRVASEQVFWLNPDVRGRSSIRWASEMLHQYEVWARAQGCNLISLASLEGQRTASLYKRCGFTLAETHHVKVL